MYDKFYEINRNYEAPTFYNRMHVTSITDVATKICMEENLSTTDDSSSLETCMSDELNYGLLWSW